MTTFFELLTPDIQIKTQKDKDVWANYIMKIGELKTGKIRFYTSLFENTLPGYSCPTSNECGTGYYSTDGHVLQLMYNTGLFAKDPGPGGLPLQLPSKEGPYVDLIFKSITSNRILMEDKHHDVIVFVRGG